MKLNVLIVVELPRSLLSLLRANEYTAKHASQSTSPDIKKTHAVVTRFSFRNKLGREEEATGIP
ncbi:MAG: hypothetical protein QXU99_00145 [Candidatus Bathyarchaeia archaeon]